MEPIRAFDSLASTGIQTQPDTSADIRNLVRIEGVRGSNPLSSTEFWLFKSLTAIMSDVRPAQKRHERVQQRVDPGKERGISG